MQHCDYFDYWGKGTEVTVSAETRKLPDLFPLIPCDLGEGEKVILGCLAQDFFPRSVSFQWTSDSNTEVDSDNFIFSQHNSNNRFTGVSVISVPRSKVLSYKCSLNHTEGNKNVEVGYAISLPDVTLVSVPNGEKQVLVCSIENMATKKASFTWEKNNNIVISTAIKSSAPQKSGPLYSDISILKVNQTDWDNKDVYTCKVMHQGQTYIQKASKAPITVTLDPPSPKEMFTNKQVKLKCNVRGQDNSILSNTEISWFTNGQNVTNNIIQNNGSPKESTLTLTLDEWKEVKKVSCSAIRENMTPITQSLIVYRGGGQAKIQVLIPSDIKENGGTLACLVTSPEQQDYYLAWSKTSGQNPEIFVDGINLPTQRIETNANPRYVVSSFYNVSKEEWNKNKFSCNVWAAGSDEPMNPKEVSSYSADISCIENMTEEDDFSSLWSTTSSFIFLFIFSLSYNMIFSLIQMKKR